MVAIEVLKTTIQLSINFKNLKNIWIRMWRFCFVMFSEFKF
jgi:hypothetical protein